MWYEKNCFHIKWNKYVLLSSLEINIVPYISKMSFHICVISNEVMTHFWRQIRKENQIGPKLVKMVKYMNPSGAQEVPRLLDWSSETGWVYCVDSVSVLSQTQRLAAGYYLVFQSKFIISSLRNFIK